MVNDSTFCTEHCQKTYQHFGDTVSLGLQKQSFLGGISLMQHIRVQHVFLVFWMEDTLELLQMLVIGEMQSVLNE